MLTAILKRTLVWYHMLAMLKQGIETKGWPGHGSPPMETQELKLPGDREGTEPCKCYSAVSLFIREKGLHT